MTGLWCWLIYLFGWLICLSYQLFFGLEQDISTCTFKLTVHGPVDVFHRWWMVPYWHPELSSLVCNLYLSKFNFLTYYGFLEKMHIQCPALSYQVDTSGMITSSSPSDIRALLSVTVPGYSAITYHHFFRTNKSKWLPLVFIFCHYSGHSNYTVLYAPMNIQFMRMTQHQLVNNWSAGYSR